jgi:hypothetical protein
MVTVANIRSTMTPDLEAGAAYSEGVYPVAPVVVSEALIGSWTA